MVNETEGMTGWVGKDAPFFRPGIENLRKSCCSQSERPCPVQPYVGCQDVTVHLLRADLPGPLGRMVILDFLERHQ